MVARNVVIASLILLCFSIVAQAKDVRRVKVPAVGETFTVKLKPNSVYVVDPFETVATPAAEIVEGCISSLGGSLPNVIEFGTQFRTLVAGSGCSLKLRVIDNNPTTNVMSFMLVRDRIEIDVTGDWKKVKLGKGSYAIFQDPKRVAIELDLENSSAGCREVHDGDKNEANRAYGIEQDKRNGKAIIENRGSWYRILPKRCNLRLRAFDGKTGKLTLFKFANKAILPR